MNTSITTIDEHIAQFDSLIQERLEIIRATILKVVPGAEEAIKYGIPTIVYKKKNLVHFAGYKGHIGFYPGASGIAHFAEELKDFKTSKGTVQIPHDMKLPLALIKKITAFRKAETDAKVKK